MAITRADLLEWFTYNLDSGEFRWRKRSLRSLGGKMVGDIAGSLQKDIRRRVLYLHGKRMYAGRAAYVYVHGDIPQEVLVDHADGDTLNDRIMNLRIASQAQNNWNRMQREGAALKLGVAKTKHGRFNARIQLPTGVKLYLGTWDSEAEAHAAYMGAAAILHGEFWINNREPAISPDGHHSPDFQKRAAEAY